MRRSPGARSKVDPARVEYEDRALPPASLARRALWVVGAGLWAFTLLSLVSFDAADWPSHTVAVHQDPVANFGGRLGAVLAYQLLLVFGAGVWLLLVASALALGAWASGRSLGHPLVRALGVLLAAAAFGGLHALWLPTWGALPGAESGLLGMAVEAELSARFGAVVVGLILLCALLLGAIIAADQLVLSLPGRLLQAARSAFQACRSALAFLRRVAAAASLRGVAWPRRGQPVAATVPPIELGAEALEAAPAKKSAPRRRRGAEAEAEEKDEAETPAPREGLRSARASKVGASAVAASAQHDEDDADDEMQAPEKAEPALRQRLTNEELRAKIARLPVRLTGQTRTVARDEDIVRTTEEASSDEGLDGFRFPMLDLLEDPETNYSEKMEAFVRQQAEVLEETLQTFSIDAEVVGIESGPVVTLFSVQLAPGTRVARLQAVASDIARSLQAQNIRILPNTAGKTTVGIEVPNLQKEKVRLKELMSGGHADGMVLPMFLGKDASGEPLVADLTRMPHMLIAGTTGSGKSVCMNSIIVSWLYTKRPDELKLVLVDPKMVEMSQFADVPHLMCPVVTEMSRAAAILEWAVNKMEERYELLREAMVRDIASYNSLSEEELYERFQPENDLERAKIPKKLPYMVFVIDELADLMMTNKEVEHFIVRIAQKARAVGIHLILATQRPQANVVTGLIKSNMPCRISFKVASGMDSRIVLDSKGAELLLGQGDMLMLNPKTSEIRRAQGTLVTDAEIRRVMKFMKEVAAPTFERSLMSLRSPSSGGEGGDGDGSLSGERDPLFDQAVEIMIESGRGSVSLLQRRLAIGYSRASRLVDQMGLAGILGDHKGSVAREVLITMDDWRAMKAMEEQEERAGTIFEGAGASEDDEIK